MVKESTKDGDLTLTEKLIPWGFANGNYFFISQDAGERYSGYNLPLGCQQGYMCCPRLNAASKMLLPTGE